MIALILYFVLAVALIGLLSSTVFLGLALAGMIRFRSDARKQLALAGPAREGGDEARIIAGVKTVLRLVEGVSPKDLKGLADDAKTKIGSGVVAFAAVDDGRVSLVVGVTDDLTKRVHAGNLIKAIAPTVGGGGGGRPNMAQAGGKDSSKLNEALQQAHKWVEDALSK